ncbi:MAG: dihydrofolate reductase family protein [Spirochaetia bacterium]|nr:dihydrofolate reductase family protein [Spirochaetia bacterium]
MRKLKLQIQTSIDGFIAGPQGEMDWMVSDWDEELKNYVREITEPVDTILLGRKLAEGFIAHWASHPDEEGAEKMNSTPKVVFSRTLAESPWENAVLAKGALVDEVNALKDREGGDLIAYGGGGFASSLIREALIDDIHIFINPTAIGRGMTLFRGTKSHLKYRLQKAKAFPCGIVVVHYERINEPLRNFWSFMSFTSRSPKKFLKR